MELLRALGTFAEQPREEHARLSQILDLPRAPDAAAYTDLFAFQLYPYASVYLGREGMLGGAARDQVAGFWRALKLVPPPEPDHLTTLLALYCNIAEREHTEPDDARRLLWTRARHTLLNEHLISWLPPYLQRVREISDEAYTRWAVLLENALAEASRSAPVWSPPPSLRDAPAFQESHDDDLDTIVSALLAPARSGIILVRSDLERAAQELGLGLRAGERRFAVRALLQQDPARVLAWLSGEASRQADIHVTRKDFPNIRTWWSERARNCSFTLEAMAGRAN
jgi:TorA maturation chaperone TorD